MDVEVVIVAVCGVIAAVLVILFVVYGRSEGAFSLDIGGAAPQASGGSDESSDTTLTGRLTGLLVAVGAVFATLVARLWSMQLINGEDYASQAEANSTTTLYTQAPRGKILDRNGNVLVTNRASLTVVASSDILDDVVEMQLLANLIGMPYQAVRRNAQDTTEGAQNLRPISVDVSRRVVAWIGEHSYVFPNASVQERTQRSYPYGSLAAHVIGYTGTVSEDQLAAETEDGDIEYMSGDVVGQTGVEYQYESVLQGVRGEQTVYVDADGNVVEYSTTIDPVAGSDIVLTLDLDIQQAAEDALAEIVEYQIAKGYACEGGCAVTLDCTTGEVLALASYPTYRPSLFVGGISSADWAAITDEDANYPMMNRAIAGQYPSGSSIKPLTSFAALDYGVATTSSTWYCPGWWSWSGEEDADTIMKCWWKSGHGTLDLAGGITNSCDIVFYEIGKGFFYIEEDEGMQETFRAYGLGSLTGIDLPGEASGRVPDAEWKWEYFSSYSDSDRTWVGGDNCNIAIGQGDLLVTLLQMATAYCSIANKGPAYVPHVLKGVRSKLGDGFVSEYEVSELLSVEEDEDFRSCVADGMYGVVYEEDEDQAAHWTNLDVTVHGKTGTAEQSTGSPLGWFVCYAPAEDPKYVVGATMDRVNSGADSSMLVVRDILGEIYDQPDDSTATATNED